MNNRRLEAVTVVVVLGLLAATALVRADRMEGDSTARRIASFDGAREATPVKESLPMLSCQATPEPVQARARSLDLAADWRPTFARESAEYYVQFSRSPAPAEWERLAEAGVLRRTHVHQRTWRVETTAEACEVLSAHPDVTAFAAVSPLDKLPAHVRAGIVIAPLPGDEARYAVEFDAAMSLDERKAIIEIHGGRFEGSFGDRCAEIVLPLSRLAGLASEPSVVSIDDSPFVPKTTCNATAQSISKVTLVQSDGIVGSGVKLAIVDGGIALGTHAELSGRVSFGDGWPTVSNHATHVSGTMIASGVQAAAEGMAPAATLLSFYWNDYAGDFAIAAGQGAVAVNNSWASVLGWNWTGSAWVDTGNHSYFGSYNQDSRQIDLTANTHAGFQVVYAAGNDRDDGPGGAQHDGVYVGGVLSQHWSAADGPMPAHPYADVVSQLGCAKNALAVGALTDAQGMTAFSAWGPADDGRIKPDVAANGDGLYSSSSSGSYAVMSGTSMASPVVTGSLALLVEKYRLSHGGANPRSDLVRAAVIQTAADWASTGYPGPDLMSGFGILDAKAAADLIGDGARWVEGVEISEEQSVDFAVDVAHLDDPKLVATLSWNDPAAAAGSNPTLVNDLDLELVGPFGQVERVTWKLSAQDPAAPATRGINSVDVNEKAQLDAPAAGAWRLRVKGAMVPVGPQRFSLAVDRAITARHLTFSAPLEVGQAVTMRVEGNPGEPYEVLLSEELLGAPVSRPGFSGDWWVGAAGQAWQGTLNASGFAEIAWTPGSAWGSQTVYFQAAIGAADGGGTAAALTPAAVEFAADINGDGVVNVDDLLLVITNWGAGPGNPADVNGDGTVNVDDLLLVITNWG